MQPRTHGLISAPGRPPEIRPWGMRLGYLYGEHVSLCLW